MKKTAVLLILSWIQYIYSPVSAQVFQALHRQNGLKYQEKLL